MSSPIDVTIDASKVLSVTVGSGTGYIFRSKDSEVRKGQITKLLVQNGSSTISMWVSLTPFGTCSGVALSRSDVPEATLNKAIILSPEERVVINLSGSMEMVVWAGGAVTCDCTVMGNFDTPSGQVTAVAHGVVIV